MLFLHCAHTKQHALALALFGQVLEGPENACLPPPHHAMPSSNRACWHPEREENNLYQHHLNLYLSNMKTGEGWKSEGKTNLKERKENRLGKQAQLLTRKLLLWHFEFLPPFLFLPPAHPLPLILLSSIPSIPPPPPPLIHSSSSFYRQSERKSVLQNLSACFYNNVKRELLLCNMSI